MSKREISLTINGHAVQAAVEPNTSLLELLRTEAGAVEVKPRSSSCRTVACG